ncbi:MAG: hypothetical protein O3A59_06670, partial [Nitrospirae bacterium]|nr:hypothetical protein [Nitrospirota bacterium]
VLPVRERERRKAPSLRARRSGKMATNLPVRAVLAKPENAAGLPAVASAKAGGFFQQSRIVTVKTIERL